jgi:hypothetical protein
MSASERSKEMPEKEKLNLEERLAGLTPEARVRVEAALKATLEKALAAEAAARGHDRTHDRTHSRSTAQAAELETEKQ